MSQLPLTSALPVGATTTTGERVDAPVTFNEHTDLTVTLTDNQPTIHQWFRETAGCYYDNAGYQAVAIDTETTGVDVHAPGFAVRVVQFATAERVLITENVQAACDALEAYARQVAAVGVSSLHVLAWNAAYDRNALLVDRGFDLYRWATVWDVAAVQRVAEPRTSISQSSDKFGKHLWLSGRLVDAAERVGVTSLREAEDDLHAMEVEGRTKTERVTNIYRTASLADRRWVRYCALDPAATWFLFYLYALRLKPHHWRTVLIERAVQEMMTTHTFDGVSVDGDRWQQLHNLYTEAVDEAEATVKTAGLKSSSTGELRAFMERKGIESVEVTPTGKPSWNRYAIIGTKLKLQKKKTLTDDEQEALRVMEAVEQHRRCHKLLTSHIDALAATDGEGWNPKIWQVHPSYRIPATPTGRMSASNPPIQQIPATIRNKGKYDGALRSMFRAREGKVLLKADYSQLEVRLIAVMGHCRPLGEAIIRGDDLHSATATEVFGSEFNDHQRYMAKQTLFGWIYGAGARKMALSSGATHAVAKQLLETLNKLYPQIPVAYKKANAEPTVWTAAGRELLLMDRWKDTTGVELYPASRQALSWMVQGSAADVLSFALLRWHRHPERRGRLWAAIHDEIIVETEPEDAERQLEVLCDSMRITLGGVPFDVEGEVLGSHWEAPPES